MHLQLATARSPPIFVKGISCHSSHKELAAAVQVTEDQARKDSIHDLPSTQGFDSQPVSRIDGYLDASLKPVEDTRPVVYRKVRPKKNKFQSSDFRQLSTTASKDLGPTSRTVIKIKYSGDSLREQTPLSPVRANERYDRLEARDLSAYSPTQVKLP